VRLHSDSEAAQSANAVNALAYTVGRHVAFANGAYQPATPAGNRLIAHELAHVVQHEQKADGRNPPALPDVGKPDVSHRSDGAAASADMPGDASEIRSPVLSRAPATPAPAGCPSEETPTCCKDWIQLDTTAKEWNSKYPFAADLLRYFLDKSHSPDAGSRFQPYAENIKKSEGYRENLEKTLGSMARSLGSGTHALANVKFDVEYYNYNDRDLTYALGGAHFTIVSGTLTVKSTYKGLCSDYEATDLQVVQKDNYTFPSGIIRELFSDYRAAMGLQSPGCGHVPFVHSEQWSDQLTGSKCSIL